MTIFITLTGRCGELRAMRVDDIRTIEEEAKLNDMETSLVTLFNGTQFVVKESIATILKNISKLEK